MRKTALLIVMTIFIITSCDNKKDQENVEIHHADEHQMHAAHKLDVKVDNKIDPICNMNTDEHLSDTIHYNNKVYGFCSTSCKEEFSKNPESYLEKLNSEE